MVLEEPASEQHTERSLHNFVDRHLKELRWTAYGLAITGVTFVLWRIKAITKFRHVSEIPPHFTAKNYQLQGHVRQVTKSGELRMEHVPILQLGMLSRNHGVDKEPPLLCVNLAGVSVTPQAVSWLTETVKDRQVWFKLLQVEGASVDCDVSLRQGRMRRRLSLSEELVRQGLCAVRDFSAPPPSPAYDHLLRRLLALEHRAQGKGRGVWREDDRPGLRGWLHKTGVSSARWVKQRLKRLFGRKEE